MSANSIPGFSVSTLQAFRAAKGDTSGKFVMKVGGRIAAAADTAEILEVACNEYQLASMRHNVTIDGFIEMFDPKGHCYAD